MSLGDSRRRPTGSRCRRRSGSTPRAITRLSSRRYPDGHRDERPTTAPSHAEAENRRNEPDVGPCPHPDAEGETGQPPAVSARRPCGAGQPEHRHGMSPQCIGADRPGRRREPETPRRRRVPWCRLHVGEQHRNRKRTERGDEHRRSHPGAVDREVGLLAVGVQPVERHCRQDRPVHPRRDEVSVDLALPDGRILHAGQLIEIDALHPRLPGCSDPPCRNRGRVRVPVRVRISRRWNEDRECATNNISGANHRGRAARWPDPSLSDTQRKIRAE